MATVGLGPRPVYRAKIARDLGCSRRVLYDALASRGAYANPAVVSVVPDPNPVIEGRSGQVGETSAFVEVQQHRDELDGR